MNDSNGSQKMRELRKLFHLSTPCPQHVPRRLRVEEVGRRREDRIRTPQREGGLYLIGPNRLPPDILAA